MEAAVGRDEVLSTRERILDVAAGLFYKKGVHGVGINEIVSSASASKLSLYKYFPSKEHLVRDMLRAHSDRIHAWLRRETATAPAGHDRVLAVFDLLMNWFAEPHYGGCTVVNTVTDTRADPQIAAIARDHLTRYRALLEELLRDAEVADPPAVARQLLLLIEGASVVATIDDPLAAGRDARTAAASLLGPPGGHSVIAEQ
ncbi:TetR/AcrR family transcriptional regulator [Streptomyces asiaticus]